jgi:hypothetical protein
MYMTLCEYAAIGSDNTATVFRAGIDSCALVRSPSAVRLAVYAEGASGELGEGDHPFSVHLKLPSGEEQVLVEGTLAVRGHSPGIGRLAIPMLVKVATAGAHGIILQLAGHRMERTLNVTDPEGVGV